MDDWRRDYGTLLYNLSDPLATGASPAYLRRLLAAMSAFYHLRPELAADVGRVLLLGENCQRPMTAPTSLRVALRTKLTCSDYIETLFILKQCALLAAIATAHSPLVDLGLPDDDARRRIEYMMQSAPAQRELRQFYRRAIEAANAAHRAGPHSCADCERPPPQRVQLSAPAA